MSCFCNIFENSTVWLIIIALILLFFFCNNDSYGSYSGSGCGCSRDRDYGRDYNRDGCCN